MDGVAKGIEDGSDVELDFGIVTPDVGHRQHDKLGECAGAVYTDALSMCAQMTPASQTVAATAAGHVAFAADQFSGMKVVDVRADFHDFADELVADDHRHGDGGTGPGVPIVDMKIGAANASAINTYEHVIRPDIGFRHIFEPKSRLSFLFDESLQ